MLTTCYGFKIQETLLRLPVKPREYVCLKLNDHTLQVISTLNVRSVTLTPDWVSISCSKEMVEIERLTGIRRLYHRGNGQSRHYRARMNSWSYGKLQRQIEYKARWERVKVIYVPARNTSKRCSVCGYKTLESTHRRLWCPQCGAILDRDENAARNLAARGLRFSPNGLPGEAVVEEREPENATLIFKVDGGKLSLQQRSTTRTGTIQPTKSQRNLIRPLFLVRDNKEAFLGGAFRTRL